MNLKELKATLKTAASAEDRVSALEDFAERLFEKGKYAEAAKSYTKAMDIARGVNLRAYLAGKVGICYYNSGQDQQALTHLLRSSRWFDPEKPGFMPDMCGFIHFHLGSLFEYHGRHKKSLAARQVCERYLQSQEKDTQWMLYAGMSRNCEALARHDEAIAYSQKAIQVLSDNDPGLAYLYESMGNSHMSLCQYQEAIKHFSKVIELDSAFERMDEIQGKLANCYHELTNHRMALESYQKLLELKLLTTRRENLTWLYAKIAHCHFVLDEFEKSLIMTLEGLRRRPRRKQELAEIRSYLTNNYYEMGRYREAVLEGGKILKLAKRFADDNLFYFRLALSCYRLGDTRSFARYKELCRRLFPDDGWNKILEKMS